uniref:CD9 molecule b n=1 Tax=Paramormyrops kingsleyae TaxID=1676925 RepID=A0A3B3S7F5_9TELE
MAALTGGDKCIKYLLFTFNFIFWLAGTAVLAIGLWLRFDPRTKSLFEGEDSPSVFFTGKRRVPSRSGVCVLNCCGASSPSPDWMKDTCPKKEGLEQYITTVSNQMFQTQASFLGLFSTVIQSLYNTILYNLPLWLQSCPSAITDIFNSKLHIIGGVGIGIGVIMIFGMIFSMMLCCAIKRSQEVV